VVVCWCTGVHLGAVLGASVVATRAPRGVVDRGGRGPRAQQRAAATWPPFAAPARDRTGPPARGLATEWQRTAET